LGDFRRHLMRARNRAGFGWTRWSTVELHEALGIEISAECDKVKKFAVETNEQTLDRLEGERGKMP
jgi:hypothetical protein